MLQRGRAWHKYKEEIIETLQNFNLSEYFHWTPEEIKKMDYEDKLNYIAIMAGMSQKKGEKHS